MSKKKIAILGSTGSIGKTLLNIIAKDKNNFQILLLTANKNYKLILKQAKFYNVRNIIITDQKYYAKAISINDNKNLKIKNNFNNLQKIFQKKIDYTMSSIVGLDGLSPTIKIIKYSKTIAIANKEPIICAWNLIKKQLKRFNTKFIPVDSEHFSIWYALKGSNVSNINKVYLTASGGSLLNVPKKKYKKLKINQILDHPNWKMGKKITIDSSNMMNKVFEIIEAKKLFNLDYKKLSITIHPISYLHAIIKFNDGMIKLIAHDTTMEIPIFNSLYNNNLKTIKTKKLDLKKLNNLNLKEADLKKFPLLKIIKKLPKNQSLFETILVSANDELVKLFLKQKISYTTISKVLIKILSLKEFQKYKRLKPKKIEEIIKLNKYVRFKIASLSI
tara:strand:+ start:1076 stop:2242 length:1167 start_codon:yes stop_codon:yes gene_type:complete